MYIEEVGICQYLNNASLNISACRMYETQTMDAVPLKAVTHNARLVVITHNRVGIRDLCTNEQISMDYRKTHL